ncbi:MAG TPA: M1 family aminopeptidase, partial [Chitinophagales bacterium]|nr:M1 family aminopeptidase [Chitinophagales bacterium]
WLHESFATYYSKQFMHKIEGESQYEWTKHAEAVQAINADRNDRFPIANSHAGSARVYPKGSFVLDMLRYVVGDSVFKRTITHYLTKHAYSNVTNHDFMMAFMETAGLNLDWFFNQWVFHAGYPNYQVSYEKQAGKLAFFIKQTQRVDNLQDYFQMPVAFEAHFTDGSTTSTTAWLSHGADTVYLNAPAGKKLEYTLFDPGYNIIKTVEFNRSYDELAAQALKAPHMIDRYEALTELRTTGIEIKRTLLNQVLNKGDYSEITIEVLQQLAKDSTPATWQLFGKALQSPDVFVRRTALDNLETIPAQLVPQAEKMLADSSYVNIEIALRKLCKQFPEKSAAYLAQVKNIKGQSDNVRIAWLELSTNIPGADSAKIQPYYHELVNYAGNSYEFRTRIKAMDALSRLNYCDSQLIYNLFNAVLYTNGRLSNPAANVLRAALKTPANLQLAKQVLEVNKWTDWQHKALEGYLKN